MGPEWLRGSQIWVFVAAGGDVIPSVTCNLPIVLNPAFMMSVVKASYTLAHTQHTQLMPPWWCSFAAIC